MRNLTNQAAKLGRIHRELDEVHTHLKSHSNPHTMEIEANALWALIFLEKAFKGLLSLREEQ